MQLWYAPAIVNHCTFQMRNGVKSFDVNMENIYINMLIKNYTEIFSLSSIDIILSTFADNALFSWVRVLIDSIKWGNNPS